ncbi:U-scoloptoxin(01)-Er1a-like [Pollicipes pollicipes]|uniref:U-scoloptoxin(01)-Er1a-like n=1 Tax=Pollicipes pollicipes TaxID=41117 RepID=UPI00188507D8|nr:U-scoloptoxin(01)-Er1a-like [Pollicipes pollicipes]
MKLPVTLLLVTCWLTARAQEGLILTPQKCKVTLDDPDGDCIIGEARIDYPNLLSRPQTSFNCDDYEYPGVYADVEADCQLFHVCPPKNVLRSGDPRDRPTTFLCTPGSLFNQEYRVCDWWFNVQCDKAPEFYADNKLYYKTSITSNSLLRDANI